MIKISVSSKDELFASMLGTEIESLGSEYKTVSEKAEISIVDLDTFLLTERFNNSHIIGFSRNEKLLPEKTIEKCAVLLHRPFLVEDLKKLIKDYADKGEALTDYTLKTTVIDDMGEIFMLDNGSSSLQLGEKKIHLSSNEYAILNKLYDNLGASVSREELNKVLSSAAGNMCDVYICRLRTKLESDGNKRFIFTVRGKGYMLKI